MNLEWGIRMVLVSRCFERIGDNAVDIGEQTRSSSPASSASSPTPRTDVRFTSTSPDGNQREAHTHDGRAKLPASVTQRHEGRGSEHEESACTRRARGRDRGRGSCRVVPTRSSTSSRAARSPGPGARSSSRSSRPGYRSSGPRSGSTSRTHRSVRAAASRPSPAAPSTSAPPMRRCRRTSSRPARAASRSRGRSRRRRSPTTCPGINCILHLTGPIIADIYSGRSRAGTTPAIKAINPKCTLPSQKITPVYRSDNSGTTYNFTDYLSRRAPNGSRRSASASTPVARRRSARRGARVSLASSPRPRARSAMSTSRTR